MSTAQVRYGRPRGSGLDDRQQLQSIAALLATNPKLKPTTAIRLLGVVDPSTVRRLRDKFRLEQSSLMAAARHGTDFSGAPTEGCNENTPALGRATPAAARSAGTALEAPPLAVAMFASWCDLGFAALSATAAAQSAATQYWLGTPHVAAAMRGQLAANAVLIAVCKRSRPGARSLH